MIGFGFCCCFVVAFAVCFFVIITLVDSLGLSPSSHHLYMGTVLFSSLISVPRDFLCSSYLPVYAEVQQPYVYLQNSHMEFSNLYLGVPIKSTIMLVNGTLLPTRFHWGKVIP